MRYHLMQSDILRHDLTYYMKTTGNVYKYKTPKEDRGCVECRGSWVRKSDGLVALDSAAVRGLRFRVALLVELGAAIWHAMQLDDPSPPHTLSSLTASGATSSAFQDNYRKKNNPGSLEKLRKTRKS